MIGLTHMFSLFAACIMIILILSIEVLKKGMPISKAFRLCGASTLGVLGSAAYLIPLLSFAPYSFKVKDVYK